jgi:polysaccharide biosynthesis protein PslG
LRNRIAFALGAAAMAAGVAFGPVGPPAGAAQASGTGYAATSPEYGMSVFVYGNAATTERDLAKLRALKFGWQKSLFRWRDIEGAGKGQFDWQEADRVVRASANAGLKIIARVDFQPAWARVDGAHNGPPDNYQDYADFIYAFVNRYKAGSPHGTVQAVEVWNEVNLDREWGGGPISQQSATDYVRLLSMAYSAAKLADPSVTVIAAGLSPTGVSGDSAQPDDVFLTWLFDAGLQGNYDVLGANANVQCPCVDAIPGTVPGFGHESFYFRRTEQLHDIMAAYGDGNKQIWLMEFGWTTDRVNPSYSWYATTEDNKAELIVQAFQFARQAWAPWIGVMTVWTVADPRWNPDDEQVWWSVTNPDGTSRLAYDRLMQARQLGQLP